MASRYKVYLLHWLIPLNIWFRWTFFIVISIIRIPSNCWSLLTGRFVWADASIILVGDLVLRYNKTVISLSLFLMAWFNCKCSLNLTYCFIEVLIESLGVLIWLIKFLKPIIWQQFTYLVMIRFRTFAIFSWIVHEIISSNCRKSLAKFLFTISVMLAICVIMSFGTLIQKVLKFLLLFIHPLFFN